MKVLFVCSGNICRSPMAAEYMRDRLADSGLAHVLVESAGTLGIEGAPASLEAIELLRESGIDLGAHRSRGLRPEDLRTADLVLVMERAHRTAIERRAGVTSPPVGEIRLLRSFEAGPEPSEDGGEVPDPIGRPMEVYRHVFDQIRVSVDHVLAHLRASGGALA